MKKRIYAGTFIHTPTLGSLAVLEDARVGVSEEGVIEWIERRERGGKEQGRAEGAEKRVVVEGRKWGGGEMEGVEVEEEGVGDGWGWYFPGFVGRFFHFFSFSLFLFSFLRMAFFEAGVWCGVGF